MQPSLFLRIECENKYLFSLSCYPLQCLVLVILPKCRIQEKEIRILINTYQLVPEFMNVLWE